MEENIFKGEDLTSNRKPENLDDFWTEIKKINPEFYKELKEFDQDLTKKRTAINNLFREIFAEDDSKNSWELRNNFLESIKFIDSDLRTIWSKKMKIESKFLSKFSAENFNKSTAELNKYFNKQTEDLFNNNEFLVLGLEEDKLKIIRDYLLSALLLSVYNLYTKESIEFREKLFNLGADCFDLYRSLLDTQDDEAVKLREKYLKFAKEDLIETDSFIKSLDLDGLH